MDKLKATHDIEWEEVEEVFKEHPRLFRFLKADQYGESRYYALGRRYAGRYLTEEMEFWDTHSVTEFEAKEVTVEEILEELKNRSVKTKVTLYLETEMQNQLKALAARRGVSYSSLIRELLWKGLEAASAETQSTVSKR